MVESKWLDKIKYYAGTDTLPEIDFRKIQEYASWYSGKVDSFHTYRMYNGDRFLEMEKKSLQMPKRVCEDWADLLTGERLDFNLPKKKDNEILSMILKKARFKSMISNAIEKSFSLGYGVITASVDDVEIGEKTRIVRPRKDSQIVLKFIPATNIVPIMIDDNRLIECAFVSSNTKETTIVIYLQNENKTYKIINLLFDNKNADVPKVFYEINTDYKAVPFATIKPNINVNSFGLDVIGMSIYANSIDTFKTIDDIFDGMSDEFPLARRRLFITTEAYDQIARINSDGNIEFTRSFDVNSSLFYRLVNNETAKNEPVKDVASEIREQSYINGLNQALMLLSKQVGLGNNRYKYGDKKVSGGAGYVTATSIIADNQELVQSLNKHKELLIEELTNLVMYIKYLNNNFTLNDKFSDFQEIDLIIDFDDSVIEDNGTKMARDKQDVLNNIMSIPEYRAKWYGETIDEAEEVYRKEFKYDIINKYLPALQSGAMTPTDFAKLVYGEKVEQETIEYITNFLNGKNKTIIEEFDEEE